MTAASWGYLGIGALANKVPARYALEAILKLDLAGIHPAAHVHLARHSISFRQYGFDAPVVGVLSHRLPQIRKSCLCTCKRVQTAMRRSRTNSASSARCASSRSSTLSSENKSRMSNSMFSAIVESDSYFAASRVAMNSTSAFSALNMSLKE